MSFRFHGLPEGVVLSELSQAVYNVLEPHTSFPWPVMHAQARRIGARAERLSLEELRELVPLLSVAVGRFTSEEAAYAVEQGLQALVLDAELDS
ncbi:MAG: hypothetical protein AAF411_11810 [Myxococcota bacterium]